MKETSIRPGTRLCNVCEVLHTLAEKFGEPVYAHFNGYYVDSTMSEDEIINGYREHWDKTKI